MFCQVPTSAAAGEAGWRLPGAGKALVFLRRWSGPVAFTVADQGLVSLAHFALTLLLARWLGPAEYGAFALSYALFLLASGLYSTLMLEPMGVIGPSHYGDRLPGYFCTILRMHAALSVGIGGLMMVAAAILGWLGKPVAAAVATVGAAVPCMLLFWLFRRACYLTARPDTAAKGSLAYAGGLAMGAAVLWLTGLVSARSVFLVMAVAGLAVSWLFGRRLGKARGGEPNATAAPAWRGVTRLHWGFARWSLPTTLSYWLASSIYLPALGALTGMAEVASYKAADNLMLPMSQMLTALGLLLLPFLSGRASVAGIAYLRRTGAKVAALAAAAAAAYAVGVLAMGPRLIRLVYGTGEYTESLGLVPYLGAAVVLRAIGDTGIGIALRAVGRPDLGFWSTLAATAVTLSLGLGLVTRFGAAGAAAGWMASSLASCGVSAWLFHTRLR